MKISTRINWSLGLAFILTIIFGSIWAFQFLKISTSFHVDVINKIEFVEKQLKEQNIPISLDSTKTTVENARLTMKYTMSLTTFLLVLIFIIISALSFILYRTTVSPLLFLIKQVKNVSSGEIDRCVILNRKDEIGFLSQAINKMTDQLFSSQEKIKDKQNKLEVALQQSQEQKYFLENVRHATINLLEDLNEEKTNAVRNAKKNELILRSMEDGVCVIDLTEKIQFMNTAGRKILGREKQNIEGKDLFKILNASIGEILVSRPEMPTTISIKEQKIVFGSKDLAFLNAKGERIAVDSIVSPLIVDKTIEGGILVFRDVTRAREVDRMKSEFVSVASHQLRTPLTSIRWHNEMLLAGDLGKIVPIQKNSLEKMHDSILRMAALVNSLLNVARIESGRIQVEPIPTDLSEVVKKVLENYEQPIQKKQIKVTTFFDQKLKKINVDPELINEVFSNLISNSIKYSRDNGQLAIALKEDVDNVLSQISDTGLGIPKDQQDKIFSKFFRAENVILEDTDGTGLGLYIVKAIIESSGGKIWFESQENQGTTFWFSLPKSGMIKKLGDRKLMPLETAWGHKKITKK
jgi:PAS domain S-box-containing protein